MIFFYKRGHHTVRNKNYLGNRIKSLNMLYSERYGDLLCAANFFKECRNFLKCNYFYFKLILTYKHVLYNIYVFFVWGVFEKKINVSYKQ